MDDIRNLFGEVYKAVNAKPGPTELTESRPDGAIRTIGSVDSLPVGPQEEYLIQKQIRPIFGKLGLNKTSIGTHPDFIELEEADTTTQNHYICTLFVDMKGSTRLSLLYPLETVYQFKNAVIKACIETIRSFDGYVHRIMGDAVMAFFGGKGVGKEDAIADMINCIVVLRSVLEESIKPWMEGNDIDTKDFGFRIGCDFGDDKEVLWGGFGYKSVGEVSATGFPVDMASKLQSLAGKDQAMLGQNLLKYVNWPNKFTRKKISESGGRSAEHSVVTPNLTGSDGSPINYLMRQLEYHKSLDFSALPRGFRARIDKSNVIDNTGISYKCFTEAEGRRTEYISATHFLKKNISLVFVVKASTKVGIQFPLKAIFRKTNHGGAVPENERDIEQEGRVRHLTKMRSGPYNKSPAPFVKVELEEVTSYRGLHTMKCEVYDTHKRLIFQDWIGVLIK